MLKEVKRPDKQKVTFTYDALGRRLTKHFSRTTTHFLWSSNVPLHEWKETFEFNYSTGLYDLGTEHSPTTWIFEAGSFVPCGLKTIARGISPKLSPLTLSTKANQKIMHCMKVVEIAKHSTYPLIVQKLLDSTIRLGKLSDKEMDNVLSPILGEEWRSYVKEYRKN